MSSGGSWEDSNSHQSGRNTWLKLGKPVAVFVCSRVCLFASHSVPLPTVKPGGIAPCQNSSAISCWVYLVFVYKRRFAGYQATRRAGRERTESGGGGWFINRREGDASVIKQVDRRRSPARCQQGRSVAMVWGERCWGGGAGVRFEETRHHWVTDTAQQTEGTLSPGGGLCFPLELWDEQHSH